MFLGVGLYTFRLPPIHSTFQVGSNSSSPASDEEVATDTRGCHCSSIGWFFFRKFDFFKFYIRITLALQWAARPEKKDIHMLFKIKECIPPGGMSIVRYSYGSGSVRYPQLGGVAGHPSVPLPTGFPPFPSDMMMAFLQMCTLLIKYIALWRYPLE